MLQPNYICPESEPKFQKEVFLFLEIP